MQPVVMTAGKRARVKESHDKLTLEVLFPRSPKPEKAEIDLINGDVPRIIVKAPEGIGIEVRHLKKP
jgi:hypothetical protein